MTVKQWFIHVEIFTCTNGQDKLLLSITPTAFFVFQKYLQNKFHLLLFFSYLHAPHVLVYRNVHLHHTTLSFPFNVTTSKIHFLSLTSYRKSKITKKVTNRKYTIHYSVAFSNYTRCQ